MAGAQRNLVLAYDLRAEGLTKVAALVPTALGGQGKQASTLIAGDMEIFLASDVVYSQRVAPLIQQTLNSNGIHGLSTAAARFLPNLGWLEPATVLRADHGSIGGAAQSGAAVTGNHGSALKGVSVGTNTLEPEPALNHISGGGNPTFTVQVENSGEFRGDERQGRRDRHRRRQTVQGLPRDRKDRTGQDGQRRHPRHRRSARRGLEDRSATSRVCPARTTSKTTRARSWRSSDQ